MADPPFAAGVGDRGEAVQQAAPTGALQQGCPVSQDRDRCRHPRVAVGGGPISGGGHDKLSRQRSHRSSTQDLDQPVSYRGSVALTARHTASVINL